MKIIHSFTTQQSIVLLSQYGSTNYLNTEKTFTLNVFFTGYFQEPIFLWRDRARQMERKGKCCILAHTKPLTQTNLLNSANTPAIITRAEKEIIEKGIEPWLG